MIYKRDAPKVTDEAGFKKLMRYNDFQHDPLSTVGCGTSPPFSAENAIAARDDLNPQNGTYPIGALGFRDHIQTDVKYTTWAYMMGKQSVLDPAAPVTAPLTAIAQSGPSYDTQPVFAFSASAFSTLAHDGMPDVWQFPWVAMTWPLKG